MFRKKIYIYVNPVLYLKSIKVQIISKLSDITCKVDICLYKYKLIMILMQPYYVHICKQKQIYTCINLNKCDSNFQSANIPL